MPTPETTDIHSAVNISDPLDAYTGRDRLLRECIDNLIFKATIGGDMPSQWRGTLHLANEIMAHVKAAYDDPDDGECMHVKTWGMP